MIRRTGLRPAVGASLALLAAVGAGAQTITEIIDGAGDGGGNTLAGTEGVAADASGNVFVAAITTDNVFRIEPGGTITEIIDSTGDGVNPLTDPFGVATDADGNVFVSGAASHNVFKIEPGGTITQIIDSTGDGGGNPLTAPFGVATDAAGNVFVAGRDSDNVFKIEPGGAITEIIDSTGDGGGNPLDAPFAVATDAGGNVYVTGRTTDNAFKITPGGTITEIIDSTGDGLGNPLDCGNFTHCGVAADDDGTVYVTGAGSDNAFRVTTGGTITEIIDSTGDGLGNPLDIPQGIGVGPSGNVYVAGAGSDNAFRITTGAASGVTVTEIIDVSGDGGGNGLDAPDAFSVAVDASDNAYVTGFFTNNAFKIEPGVTPPTHTVTEIMDSTGDGASPAVNPDGIDVDGDGNVYVGTCGNNPSNTSVFKITPGGAVTEILDGTGDGTSAFDCAVGIELDSAGNVYAAGHRSDNVFKVTPGGVISKVMDDADGILAPFDIDADLADNIYVSGFGSDNAFKVTPGGVITEIIDSTGDGTHGLAAPFGISVDAAGNVYLAGNEGNNAFRITPRGVITQIIDATGDGINPCLTVTDVDVDRFGSVYVACNGSDNVFRITNPGAAAGGTITQILDSSSGLDNPTCLWVDREAIIVYVAAFESDNAYKITRDGVVTEIITSAGDGANVFTGPADDCIVADAAGVIHVTGTLSHNVFRIDPPPCEGDVAPPREVGVDDFLAVLAAWGRVGVPEDFLPPPGVGIDEFLAVLDNWGSCP